MSKLLDAKILELLNKGIIDIDDIVSLTGGVYVLPQRPGQPQFAIRDLISYCKNKGIDPSQITDKELETLVINWDELAEPYKNGTLKISESLPYDYRQKESRRNPGIGSRLH